MSIDFNVHLMRDGQTYSVRYACACGCKPQVKLKTGSEAAHEHCCCGIAHAAGPDARAHLEAYLGERRAQGLDADRRYSVHDARVQDPWGATVAVSYAVPDATGEPR